MITPIYTPVTVNAGQTLVVPLFVDPERINNTIAVSSGTSGILSFKVKVLFGQMETPEAPNSIDIASRKSISFNGSSLEAIEITNSGASAVSIVITRY